jgi:adenylate kinase family enzyme
MNTSQQHAIILIGRSGSGKGTQAKFLIEHLTMAEKANGSHRGVLYLQNGAEFRNFIKGDSVVAKLSAETYAKNMLQPEFLAVHMWTSALVRDYQGHEHLILDGMPRKAHEAGVVETMLDFIKINKPTVIHIDVSEAVAGERILARHRMDDVKNDISVRMNWYEHDVVPAIEYYRNNPKYNFIEINGEQTVEEVSREIAESLGL